MMAIYPRLRRCSSQLWAGQKKKNPSSVFQQGQEAVFLLAVPTPCQPTGVVKPSPSPLQCQHGRNSFNHEYEDIMNLTLEGPCIILCNTQCCSTDCLLMHRCQLHMFRAVTVHPQELPFRCCMCRLWYVLRHSIVCTVNAV